MPTFLFDNVIFGPVQSRRMGVSLGVNLLPTSEKFCNYNCIYCECGFTPLPTKDTKSLLPPRSEVKVQLKNKLKSMNPKPDAITFAGNGEPTIHPEFCEIIDDTIEMRNEICPDTEIVVLTNATQIHKAHIIESLQKIDRCMFKLDAGFDSTIEKINKPLQPSNVAKFIELVKQFKGKIIIQTLFIKGEYNGEAFDNTLDEEVEALLDCYKKIQPNEVVVYGIQRDTPVDSLYRIPKEKLEEIAMRIKALGIQVSVSY